MSLLTALLKSLASSDLSWSLFLDASRPLFCVVSDRTAAQETSEGSAYLCLVVVKPTVFGRSEFLDG